MLSRICEAILHESTLSEDKFSLTITSPCNCKLCPKSICDDEHPKPNNYVRWSVVTSLGKPYREIQCLSQIMEFFENMTTYDSDKHGRVMFAVLFHTRPSMFSTGIRISWSWKLDSFRLPGLQRRFNSSSVLQKWICKSNFEKLRNILENLDLVIGLWPVKIENLRPSVRSAGSVLLPKISSFLLSLIESPL